MILGNDGGLYEVAITNKWAKEIERDAHRKNGTTAVVAPEKQGG